MPSITINHHEECPSLWWRDVPAEEANERMQQAVLDVKIFASKHMPYLYSLLKADDELKLIRVEFRSNGMVHYVAEITRK